MATSGSKSVKITDWDTLKFSWETTSQSKDDNTSTVSWKLQLVATGSGAINSSAKKDWSVKVNGKSYSGTNTIGISNNTTKNLATGTTVIEHNTDVMKLADYIIDVGPDGGTKGGKIVFTGTPKEMIEHGNTITAEYLRKSL